MRPETASAAIREDQDLVDHPKNYSKSANRALDVLAFIAEADTAVRAAVIADRLGIARSSADQLLKTMVDGGYLIVSAEDKTYLPSLRLASFGRWMCARYPMEARFNAILAEVCSATGETVALTVQNDCFMQIMQVAGGQAGEPVPEIGLRVPMFGCAIGNVALAAKSRRQISRLVARARHLRLIARGHAMPATEQIESCQMKGYASLGRDMVLDRDDGRETIPIWSIAMALPGTRERANVVLGLTGPRARVRQNETDIVRVIRRSIRSHFATASSMDGASIAQCGA